jgi:hypothetical protein
MQVAANAALDSLSLGPPIRQKNDVRLGIFKIYAPILSWYQIIFLFMLYSKKYLKNKIPLKFFLVHHLLGSRFLFPVLLNEEHKMFH